MLQVFYNCPECHCEWDEESDCACDSECGECGCENITPMHWKNMTTEPIVCGSLDLNSDDLTLIVEGLVCRRKELKAQVFALAGNLLNQDPSAAIKLQCLDNLIKRMHAAVKESLETC